MLSAPSAFSVVYISVLPPTVTASRSASSNSTPPMSGMSGSGGLTSVEALSFAPNAKPPIVTLPLWVRPSAR